MTTKELQQTIARMMKSLSVQIPTYKDSKEDWSKCDGNLAVCLIDDDGNIYGKIWGRDKIRGRRYFDIAYRKASQVWITGYKTGEYEKLVFNKKLNPKDYGIELPDLMGWEGGQPIQLDKDTRISCGFSGFRGVNDLAIVEKAAKAALSK